MSIYVKTNEVSNVFFPIHIEEEEIFSMIFKNNQTNKEYEISVLTINITERGFIAPIIVTGKEAEPIYTFNEEYETEINIPVGTYNVKCFDIDGNERIVMLHIKSDTTTTVYTAGENKDIIYNG